MNPLLDVWKIRGRRVPSKQGRLAGCMARRAPGCRVGCLKPPDSQAWSSGRLPHVIAGAALHRGVTAQSRRDHSVCQRISACRHTDVLPTDHLLASAVAALQRLSLPVTQRLYLPVISSGPPDRLGESRSGTILQGSKRSRKLGAGFARNPILCLSELVSGKL